MANIFVPPEITDAVIKVDGVCYEYVGPSEEEVTHEDIDGTFETCEECEEEPGECPDDVEACAAWPATVDVVFSGCAGDGTATLTSGICSYSGYTDDVMIGISITCSDGIWTIHIFNLMTGESLYLTAPAGGNNPPPTDGYSVDNTRGTCFNGAATLEYP